MKIQTKLTALLLTLPIAYATTLSGSIAETNGSIALSTDPSIGATGYTTGVITLTLNNNTADGWKAEAASVNGSMFALQESGANAADYATADGKNLQYDVSCEELVADSSNLEGIAAMSSVSLDTANTNYVISTESSPSYPSTGSIACSIDLITGESVEELFAGSYAETITLSISNL